MSGENRARRSDLSVISLFTGAGGLDLGLEYAGFDVRVCVEIDEECRETIRRNRPTWRLTEPGDVFAINPEDILREAGLERGETFLVSGGPPCQPFSKAGFWVNGESARLADPRSRTLNEFLRVVEVALPQVVLFENVAGMAYKGKDEGIKLLRDGIRKINSRNGTQYNFVEFRLNAVHYGVPQKRERLFLIAVRDGLRLRAPEATHSVPDESQEIENKKRPQQKCLTCWDAIGDLDTDNWDPDLSITGKWAELIPSIPEGYNYLWHTNRHGGAPLFGWRTRYWSFLLKLAKNMPSWTIPASPGPSTGPFHWKNRRLSVRELCRLQTFPDDYEICGNYRSAHRQVGNAVPPAIGELIGKVIRSQVLGEEVDFALSLIPKRRNDCPPPEPIAQVPKKYWQLLGEHRSHPGTGKGPGALARNARQERPSGS